MKSESPNGEAANKNRHQRRVEASLEQHGLEPAPASFRYLLEQSFADLPALMRPSVLAPVIGTTQQRLAHDRVKGVGIPWISYGRSIFYSKAAVVDFFAARVRTSTQFVAKNAANAAA